MEEIQTNYNLIFPALISLIFLCSITKYFLNKSSPNKNLPPSPPRLPILGNLHQIGALPRYNLQRLAGKYGPLTLLHAGRVPVLIVSSADGAREIMKTHDLNFASRPQFSKINFESTGVVFAPYGEYWRQAKQIFVLQLLSNKRVQSSRSIREEETLLFLTKIEESESKVVNLSEMFAEFTNDGICRSALGTTYSRSEKGKKFMLLMKELSELLGAVRVGEFIPWLGWIDRVFGYDEKASRIARGLDDFLEGVIHERLQSEKSSGRSLVEKNGESFLDIMLQIYNGGTAGYSIDRSSIKAILLDIFSAGTDTSAILLEWVMTELLRHPKVMDKVQKEVREIVRDKQLISDDDIEKMHYLKAVIKETFRYHPPVPFLVPRIGESDVKINGYDVAAGTVVMINVWAISRDPACWDEPEKFNPERFLNSSVEFKGSNFEFIPFGAGRRSCPGIAFSMANIELVLANLMQKFNWKLPDGVEVEDLDVRECPGVLAHKDVPLLAIATQVKMLNVSC
ncbi:hypothetical protein C2S53_011101 [Perilla frutescens var. hirtella]|uniref:Cytochrome P450 n=1 Tax=Perilla frutescens var. hirtella TaxID=608512 RepID=A0AAD4IS39_PERFH|nr:hypothetical protein C2S53_011101 [Perilla frutescens var. hirtella]